MATKLERAIALAEEAYEAGEFDDMLRFADEALAVDPRSTAALDLKANALAELGEWEAADELFASLMKADPGDATLMLAAADVKVRQPGDDRERIEAGLKLLERAWPALSQSEELSIETELLRGVGYSQLGEHENAIEAFGRALDLDPDHGEAQLERALSRFELGHFDLARRDFERLTREFPDDAWSVHYLGLIAERQGREAEAEALFARARKLSPDDFPPPVKLSTEAFDRAVKESIEALPEHARPHLANVIITVEPIPGDDEIREGLSPTILGVFSGTPIDERNPTEAGHHQTARITLYQRNLERFARDREELLEEIRITVLHEVGHLLGLDEDELYERGLD
jgi:predicted Zn-dependent protease with MMP-like domain/Flp pilus assembly protein TadD